MHSRRFLIVLLVVTSACAAQSTSRGCAASHYKVVALPLLPARINDSGLVAGTTARIDEDHQPALWSEKDGLRVIDLPEGIVSAEPHAINASGEIVGTATREGSK